MEQGLKGRRFKSFKIVWKEGGIGSQQPDVSAPDPEKHQTTPGPLSGILCARIKPVPQNTLMVYLPADERTGETPGMVDKSSSSKPVIPFTDMQSLVIQSIII